MTTTIVSVLFSALVLANLPVQLCCEKLPGAQGAIDNLSCYPLPSRLKPYSYVQTCRNLGHKPLGQNSHTKSCHNDQKDLKTWLKRVQDCTIPSLFLLSSLQAIDFVNLQGPERPLQENGLFLYHIEGSSHIYVQRMVLTASGSGFMYFIHSLVVDDIEQLA
jgi:hypothetical protein